MFGIEIRRAGTMPALFHDVQRILTKHGMSDVNPVSDAAKIQTVAHALHKMLSVHSYLSICVIESCAKVCQVFIPAERIEIYRTAHCMNWSEMLPDYREMMMAMILDDFKMVLAPEIYCAQEIIKP